MGSVQSWGKCPHCSYEGCIFDSYYKSGEEYVNCPRCGYSYSRNVEYDVEKTKQVWKNVKWAFIHGEFRKAFDLSEEHFTINEGGVSRTDADMDNDECAHHVNEWLKRVEKKEYRHWYLKDSDGKVVFKEDEVKPAGAFRYKHKGAVATLCGCYEDEESLIRDVMGHLDELDEAKYTKKVDGVWMMVDMLTMEKTPFKGEEGFDG